MFNLKTVLGLTAAVSCAFVSFNPAQAEIFSSRNVFAEDTEPINGETDSTCLIINLAQEKSECTNYSDWLLDLEPSPSQSNEQVSNPTNNDETASKKDQEGNQAENSCS
jgi:hypothetical protein